MSIEEPKTEQWNCACVHHDARECTKLRDGPQYYDLKRLCECACHKDQTHQKDYGLCILRVSRSASGRAFAVHLRDGTKIIIANDGKAAWLEIFEQAKT